LFRSNIPNLISNTKIQRKKSTKTHTLDSEGLEIGGAVFLPFLGFFFTIFDFEDEDASLFDLEILWFFFIASGLYKILDLFSTHLSSSESYIRLVLEEIDWVTPILNEAPLSGIELWTKARTRIKQQWRRQPLPIQMFEIGWLERELFWNQLDNC